MLQHAGCMLQHAQVFRLIKLKTKLTKNRKCTVIKHLGYDWVFYKVCYLKKKTPFNKMIRDHSGHGHSQWQIVLMFPIGCDHTKNYFWIQWIIVFSYARDPTTGCRYIVNTLPFSVQSSCSVFTWKYAELYVHIFYVLVWYSYAMPSKS